MFYVLFLNFQAINLIQIQSKQNMLHCLDNMINHNKQWDFLRYKKYISLSLNNNNNKNYSVLYKSIKKG